MAAGRFCGPLAGEFAAFAATSEASATADKTTLAQLRVLDRYTAQRGLPSATIDENLAKAWLADCAARAPDTRRARYYLLRRFCRFLAARRPGTSVPGESLRPRRRPPKLPRIYTRAEVRAVTRLLLWYRDGENVMATLPLLSTCLGHACISDTEVYLRITTALLQEANTRFHAFAEALLPAAGDQS